MSAPILLILGNPCNPTTVRIDLYEDKELPMPHGIDDDNQSPEPTDNFHYVSDGKGGIRPSRPLNTDTTSGIVQNFTFPLNSTEPVIAQSTPPVPEKIIYTGEDIAAMVAVFHNRLRSDLHGPWQSERFEIMISILTQDYLHSLLTR